MATPVRNIVFGVADVGADDPYLAPAAALAERLGATLHAVHAFHLPDPAVAPYPEMAVFSPEAARQVREGIQRRLEDQVRRATGGRHVVCRTLPGPADRAILEAADWAEADLILVGGTRRGTFARVLLGTTAQRVTRGARVPVLVRLDPRAGPPRRILLTTDLSGLSAAVQRRALELVSALEGGDREAVASLLVVGSDLPLPPPLTMEGVAAGQLATFLRRVHGEDAGVEGRVRLGDPAQEIVGEAGRWRADLLVLGTHGRTGASRLLIGSVAESVLRNAACDVLVVPGGAVADAPDLDLDAHDGIGPW